MARTEANGASSGSSGIDRIGALVNGIPEPVLINGIAVPVFRGTSNYDTWRAKFEQAVKTKDPVSWRILNGETTDPVEYLGDILSERRFARTGAAEHLKVHPKNVTVEQMRQFLDDLSTDGTLIQADYTEALRTEWEAKIESARALMDSTLSGGIVLPGYYIDDLEWARLRFSSTGYHTQADAWKRWLELQFKPERPEDHRARRAFAEEFESRQKQLEGKIGQTIPRQVAICQFITALQEPKDWERVENLAVQVTKSGDPVDEKEVYGDFSNDWYGD